MTTLGTADLTLTATNQSIYANMNTGPVMITKMIAANTDASARTITIYKVPGAGTAGSGNIVTDALSIAAGATVTLPFSGLVLNIADSLQGFASVTSVVNVSVGWTLP